MENMVDSKNLNESYKNKNVFITGHTGFKGSWLCSILLSFGAKVKGYALSPEYNNTIYNSLIDDENFESVIADIRDTQKLSDEIFSFQPDYIFHLAAQPLVRRSYKFPTETFEINVIGTANLLECMKQITKSCVTVVITTDKVYENKEKNILYKEEDRLGGYDPYSASKACTELVVSSFRNSFFHVSEIENHKKAIATARAGNVIGGGDLSEDRIIPDIVKALLKDETIEVRSPSAVRPWQHVLEPLFGYLLLGANLVIDPLKFSQSFNFGPNATDHLTVKEVVEKCILNMGKGSWKDVSKSKQPHEANLLMLNIDKAKTVLGWEPKLNSSEAISWTMNWFKENEINSAQFTIEQIAQFQKI